MAEVPFVDFSAMTEEVREDISQGWRHIVDCGTFIGGAAVEGFEHEWARYCGTRFAVGLANGTDALHLTFRALGIGDGDEVVVPANTFVATAEAVALAGATPRFADVDPDTLLMTPETLAAAVTPATRAVAVVHLYGQMADMDALTMTAEALGLYVIEDAAQAHGAQRGTARAGSVGVAGCFSFYPGKNLGAFGDAGAVVTSDARLAATLRSLRDHGRVGSDHYQHAMLGTNSRLDALQAVALSVKLRRLDSWNAARRDLMAVYGELLDPDVALLVRQLDGGRGVHHLAVVQVLDRDRLREALAHAGVATGVHYPTPCHRMAPFAGTTGTLPVAEAAAPRLLSLPLFPHMTSGEVERVAKAVNGLARPGVQP